MRALARLARKHWLWLVIPLTAVAFVVISSVERENRSSRKSLENLTEVMDLIQAKSVEPPSPEQIVHASLQGMLHTLDPHSDYMDATEFRLLKEEHQGSFFGVGCSILQLPDGVFVKNAVRGSPSANAGILSGDCIREINGESTVGWTMDQIIRKMHGKEGTQVEVAMQRIGVPGLMRFRLTRTRIHTDSVSFAFMITAHTGLIVIKDFGENTAGEFERALAGLQKQGMKELILDLRDNPGGLVNAAVKVIIQVLGPNERVVSQKGRGSRDTGNVQTPANATKDLFPVVVLINRDSASSAEIVAGAIQDNDRGLVVGTTSWGKGLVQTVFPVGRSCGLRLTTARYFTPSGRCIQRDYQHGLDDYWLPDEGKGVAQPRGPAYRTDLDRVVYGGGGIAPDYVMEEARLTPFVAALRARYGAFFAFAVREQHSNPGKAVDTIDAATMSRFKAFLQEKKIHCTDSDWDDSSNQTAMLNQLTFETLTLARGPEAGFRYFCDHDPQVMKALEVMPESEGLMRRKAQGLLVADRNLAHPE